MNFQYYISFLLNVIMFGGICALSDIDIQFTFIIEYAFIMTVIGWLGQTIRLLMEIRDK